MKAVYDTIISANKISTSKYKLFYKGDNLFLRYTGVLSLGDVDIRDSLRLNATFGKQISDPRSTDGYQESYVLSDFYDSYTGVLEFDIVLPKNTTIMNTFMTIQLFVDAGIAEGPYKAMVGGIEVYEEQVVNNKSVLLVPNFVDMRLVEADNGTIDEPDTDELQNAIKGYKERLAGAFNRNYNSDLYYSFAGPLRKLKLFFGIGLETFILDNSYITAITSLPDFTKYLDDTDFAVDIQTKIYDDDGTSYKIDITKEDNTYQLPYSNLFVGELETQNIEFSNKALRCDGILKYDEPIQKFLNEQIIPDLQKEMSNLMNIGKNKKVKLVNSGQTSENEGHYHEYEVDELGNGIAKMVYHPDTDKIAHSHQVVNNEVRPNQSACYPKCKRDYGHAGVGMHKHNLLEITKSILQDEPTVKMSFNDIRNTLIYANAVLFEGKNDLSLFSNNNNTIYIDDELEDDLIRINQRLQTFFKELISNNAKSSSETPALEFAFDEEILIPTKNKFVEVLEFADDTKGLNSVGADIYASASLENITKYFASTTVEVYQNSYDLNPMSYRYFTANNFKLGKEEFKNTFSYTGEQLTSKTIYDYYNTILQIIELNSDKKAKLPTQYKTDGITSEQFLAQERSRQLANLFDFVTIESTALNPTQEREEDNFQAIADKSLLRLPKSMRGDTSIDKKASNRRAEKVDVDEINTKSAFPVSVLAPIVLKNVKVIDDTTLFDYKKLFSDSKIAPKIRTMPPQIAFIAAGYLNDGRIPGFISEDPVYNNFVNFGLLYLTTQFLFKIQYFDTAEESFKDLDATSFNQNLNIQRKDLLCRIVPYKNYSLGVGQPKSLSLPIYNKHFVIRTPPQNIFSQLLGAVGQAGPTPRGATPPPGGATPPPRGPTPPPPTGRGL